MFVLAETAAVKLWNEEGASPSDSDTYKTNQASPHLHNNVGMWSKVTCEAHKCRISTLRKMRVWNTHSSRKKLVVALWAKNNQPSSLKTLPDWKTIFSFRGKYFLICEHWNKKKKNNQPKLGLCLAYKLMKSERVKKRCKVGTITINIISTSVLQQPLILHHTSFVPCSLIDTFACGITSLTTHLTKMWDWTLQP